MFKKIYFLSAIFLYLILFIPQAHAQVAHQGFMNDRDSLVYYISCGTAPNICSTTIGIKDEVWSAIIECPYGALYDPSCAGYTGFRYQYWGTKTEAMQQLYMTNVNILKTRFEAATANPVRDCYDISWPRYICSFDYFDLGGGIHTMSLTIDNGHTYQCPNDGKYVTGLGCTTTQMIRPPESKYCLPCMLGAAAKYMAPVHLITQRRGDPIDIATASVYEQKTDIAFPIPFTRTYNSSVKDYSILGTGWKQNFDKKLSILTKKINNIDIPFTLVLTQDNTEEFIFTRDDTNSPFVSMFNDQKTAKISIDNTGTTPKYIFTIPNGNKETYDNNGNLVIQEFSNGLKYTFAYSTSGTLNTITNNYGQFLNFAYNNLGFIDTITGSNGNIVKYDYINGQLTSMKFNNNLVEGYGYTNNLLTEIRDSTNTKIASFTYDTSGKAIQNAKILNGLNIEQHDFTYDTSSVYETQPNGNSVSYQMSNVLGKNKISRFTEDNRYYSLNYDNNGNVSNYVGVNGSFYYTYDSNTNLLQSVQRADGKVVYMTWDNENSLLTSFFEPLEIGDRTTNYTYDQYRNITTKTVSGNGESRTWTYTYDIGGKPLTVNNPDGTGLTYTYYDMTAPLKYRGLLKSITNKLNQVTTVNSYDNRGNPTSITGITGITKTMTYDMRNNLLTDKIGNAINTYTYNGDNDLINIMLSNNYQLTMVYDTAHRLTAINDNNGGSSTFILDDTTGVATNEDTYQNNTLVKTKNKIIDELGRTKKLWASNQSIATEISYNGDDSINWTVDGNGFVSKNNLNELKQTQSTEGISNLGSYIRNFDGVATTITGNNLNTTVIYNIFGEPTSSVSPDSGNHTYTTDLANRTSTHVDGQGISHTIYYDLAGKVFKITHLSSIENINYNTNNTVNYIQNNTTTYQYGYDTLARRTQQTQTTNGKNFIIKYTYNDANQITSMTYPSGMIVNYTYVKGFLTGMTTSGAVSANVLSHIQYQSLQGLPVAWNLDSDSINVTYNEDGFLSSFIDSTMNQVFTTDNVGNVKTISDSINNNSISVEYNAHQQVISSIIDGNSTQYNYNGNFNLDSKTDNSGVFNLYYKNGSNTLSQVYDGSNMINISSTNRGDVMTDGLNTFAYDIKNNLATSSNDTEGLYGTYKYDFFKQRVSKAVNGVTTYFVYNDGQLVGEYDTNGNVISEHIYFGLRPVGLYKNGQVMTVHTDYLGTPREIRNGNTPVWKWENKDIFGGNLPSLQTIEYNLRFSGQYFDKENKLHYNINRTYNPKWGRYMQSDPMGLAAGFNTYNYVDNNPMNKVDPLGLKDANRIQFSLVHYPNKDASILEVALAKFSNFYFMHKEEEIKESLPTNPDLLTLGGHGSAYSLNGNSYTGIGNMIINGQFNMGDGFYKSNNFFKNKLKKNEDINIKLEACDTGIVYKNGKSFASNLADMLRNYALSQGYTGRITVYAPNGLSTFWHIGDYYKETVVKDGADDAGYGAEPDSFKYNAY